MTTAQHITDFLSQKRLAVVGVSRKEKAYSRQIFRTLWKQGYDAVPVNPNTKECDGLPCVARVQNIIPPVGAALIVMSKEHVTQAVRDCAEAGIKKIWIPLSMGKPMKAPAEQQFCKDNGIELITDFCPYMFLPSQGFPHNFHGWVARLSKEYRTEK